MYFVYTEQFNERTEETFKSFKTFNTIEEAMTAYGRSVLDCEVSRIGKCYAADLWIGISCDGNTLEMKI